jgi:hypothetical protein
MSKFDSDPPIIWRRSITTAETTAKVIASRDRLNR